MGGTDIYDSVVIGAGPGGLATICTLLDGGLEKILWIDRAHQGGRLNGMYREISSNTKVGIYLDAINSSRTCRRIIDSTPSPNAVTRLETIDRDETCQLSLPGDMAMMLSQGMDDCEQVTRVCGEVEEVEYNNQMWTVSISRNHESIQASTIQTPRLFLCTGSHPTHPNFHPPYNSTLTVLDLDECLILSKLPKLLPDPPQKAVVAIIGNSHSGVLVCKNLYEVATSSSPSISRKSPRMLRGDSEEEDDLLQRLEIEVLLFSRRRVKYAEYRDDGIVYDNTGLKGATATWAKEVLEEKDGNGVIKQIDLGDEESTIYNKWLPRCSHIIYATGYERSPLPRISINGDLVAEDQLVFDQNSSGFTLSPSDVAGRKQGIGNKVKGLYGCGIAFPEESTDPEGNVELAVGLAKFFKFAQRVQKVWLGNE